MKSSKLITLVFLMGALLITASCEKDFEELRVNTNNPETVSAELLLPTIIRNPVTRVVEEAWSSGNVIAQHTAKIQFTWGPTYDLGGNDGLWESMYNTLRDVNNVIDISRETGNDNYRAIALIMKSWIFSVLTDSFGDVPYAEATKGKEDGTLLPGYDSQEEIYEGILTDLATANEIILVAGPEVAGDILYNGDMMKWKQLANSLRLRYLMRISDKMDVDAEMAEMAANPDQYPIFQSNEDNAALAYLPAFPNQWPIHTYRVGSFDEYRLSKTLGDRLMALHDPRLQVFARPTAATINTDNPEYVGVPNGLNDAAALAYNGGTNNVSRIGPRYYEQTNMAKGIIMTYAELQFILAEAASKGWISGEAEAYYLNGLNASFNFYDIEPDPSYFEQPGVTFEPATALEQIALQKWIALFFNGFEAWFDYRRTGMPELVPVDGSDRIISRWEYPGEEQTLNKENYQEAIERQGADDNKTLVWWEK